MPALLPILSGIWSFATSQIGIVAIASLLSFGYGHHRASVACNNRIASMHAVALQAVVEEQSRQVKEREKFNISDASRVVDQGTVAIKLQAEVDALKAQLNKKVAPNAKDQHCDGVDPNDFARRVQRQDRSYRR